MKYTIQISELLSHSVTVEADTAEEARQKVMVDYYNGDIVLTADDYVDGSVELEVISEKKETSKDKDIIQEYPDICFILFRGYDSDKEQIINKIYEATVGREFFDSDYYTKLFTFAKSWFNNSGYLIPVPKLYNGSGCNHYMYLCKTEARSLLLDTLRRDIYGNLEDCSRVPCSEDELYKRLDQIWLDVFGKEHPGT